VAHEIKNSLTPMRLSVQLLQRNIENGNASPEQIQRTSATLIEQIDALSDISASFSRYAKLPENHPQPLDLAELVGNVVNLYDNVENIKFHYEYDSSKTYVFNGDKTNLNSAVGNIIKNATQAIGNKSDGRIDVKLQSDERAFVISVKDNGKGIKEEDKKMIFVPNFTTKTGGSGVGLSLTYNIIQASGGTITFESQEGVGTEFVITLPKQ
jgi:signal transduction histidine kinase